MLFIPRGEAQLRVSEQTLAVSETESTGFHLGVFTLVNASVYNSPISTRETSLYADDGCKDIKMQQQLKCHRLKNSGWENAMLN